MHLPSVSRLLSSRGWRPAVVLVVLVVLVAVIGGVPGGLPRAHAETAPAARITLQDAVARGLARNPTVVVARAEIERADALVRQARAGAYPTLVGTGIYTHAGNGQLISGLKTPSDNLLNANLLLTVPLVAPTAWAQVWRAGDNRRIAEASAEDIRRQLALAVARAYLAVVAQHRVITANENARNTAQAHYDFAHTRFAGGIGRSIDEVRAEQELRANEVAVEGGYAALARAREALGVLVAADGAIDSVDDVALDPAPTLDAALADARSQRADVKAQGTRLAADQRLVKDDWVFYAPILAAVGQPFYGSSLDPRVGWQAQLILTLPLYDGGLRGGIARERDALVLESRAGLESTLRQAQSDVRAAFDALLHADKALSAARAASVLARRALELANMAYRAGATGNLEVIDASRASHIADTAAAQAEDVARQARLDLLSASGHFP